MIFDKFRNGWERMSQGYFIKIIFIFLDMIVLHAVAMTEEKKTTLS